MIVESHQKPSSSCGPPQILTLLRICAAKPTEFGRPSAHELIALKARELHMAGATVIEDSAGHTKSPQFPVQSRIDVDDASLIIEIIDDAKHIEAFLPVLGEMVRDGILTLKSVQVLPGYSLNGTTQ